MPSQGQQCEDRVGRWSPSIQVETSPVHTWISDVWPPELRGNKCPLPKPAILWPLIMAALQIHTVGLAEGLEGHFFDKHKELTPPHNGTIRTTALASGW